MTCQWCWSIRIKFARKKVNFSIEQKPYHFVCMLMYHISFVGFQWVWGKKTAREHRMRDISNDSGRSSRVVSSRDSTWTEQQHSWWDGV